MERAISKENTTSGTESELTSIVGSKIRPTSTPKNSKRIIFRLFFERELHGRMEVDNLTRQNINNICWKLANKCWCRSPNIRKDKIKGSIRYAIGLAIRKLVTISFLT